MARTSKSDLSTIRTHFGNGSTAIDPILFVKNVTGARTSDFTINPPNVRIDTVLAKLVVQTGEKLRMKALKTLDTEKDWELKEVLDLPNGKKDNAKATLAKDGKSAVISEVSKAINASSIDHSSRFLLSNEPFYVYALSYAIYHEEVNEAEGVNDRVLMVTENNIKTYFNRLLAKEYIKNKHIDLSKEQKNQILKEAEKTTISYLQGEPAKAIGQIVAKFVDYGDLNRLVDKFFKEGPIDPEKDNPRIRQLMVKYLVDIGLKVSKKDFEEEENEDDDEDQGGRVPDFGDSISSELPSSGPVGHHGGSGAGGPSSIKKESRTPDEISKSISEKMDITPGKEAPSASKSSIEGSKSSKSEK